MVGISIEIRSTISVNEEHFVGPLGVVGDIMSAPFHRVLKEVRLLFFIFLKTCYFEIFSILYKLFLVLDYIEF